MCETEEGRWMRGERYSEWKRGKRERGGLATVQKRQASGREVRGERGKRGERERYL